MNTSFISSFVLNICSANGFRIRSSYCCNLSCKMLFVINYPTFSKTNTMSFSIPLNITTQHIVFNNNLTNEIIPPKKEKKGKEN